MEYKRNGLCVEALIQYSNSQDILLVKRANDPFKGCWGLPGGFVEFGEHPINAIAREVKEETNIDATRYKEAGNYLEQVGEDFRYIILFRTKIEMGTFKLEPDPSEVLAVAWFDLKNLPANVVPGFTNRITRILDVKF